MNQTIMIPDMAILDWTAANETYLAGELRCLRLRLQRRIRWLRQQWQPNTLHGYAEVVSDQQADWLLADTDQEAEQRFYEEDSETAVLTQALHTQEREQVNLSAAMIEAGIPPALHLLAHLFGLNEFERRVMLLSYAPEHDPGFADLYAYVQDQASRKYATPHLALTLFGDGENDRASFLPEEPLRRFALIALESGVLPATAVANCPLRLPPRIGDYLRGIDHLDTQVADLLYPIFATPLAPTQERLVERLAQLLSAETDAPSRLNLVGETGVGKQTVAEAICQRLGMRLYRLVLPEAQVRPPGLLRLLAREAVLSQLAYYLDLTVETMDGKTQEMAVHDLIERLQALLFVGSVEPWPAERPLTTITVAKPTGAEQTLLWQQALAKIPHTVGDRLGAIVQQFDFGPRSIAKAVNAAYNLAQLRVPDDGIIVTADDLWQACRQRSAPRLLQLARRIIPVYTWDDIVLPADLRQQLRELAAQVAQRHRVYETWGFGAQMSRGRGISALFAGPSGTGKTMAAEILAHELNLDLYRIDLSGVISKYIGETEKNLKQVFDAAEQSGAILFFDEADALFGKRTEVKDSHDRYANIEVNYLLQRMEEYRGLAILATNRKTALDKAFLRRLRFLLDFPFPDLDSRRRIWEKVFPANAPLDSLDYDVLARLEIPGGNIRNIALNAAFLAANEEQSIGLNQIMCAARREYGKIDKMMTPYEFGDYYRNCSLPPPKRKHMQTRV